MVVDSMGGCLVRGRRPAKLTIARRDQDALHCTARGRALPWFQVQRAEIVLAIAAGERQGSVAARLECDEATVWRACERYRHDGLAGLFADGRQGNAGHPQLISPVQRAQIVELACLEPIAKGTSPIGPARIWPAKRWLTRSSLRLARQRFAAFCTMSICSRIGLAIGRQLAWISGSKRGRSKSFGAMGMRLDLPNRAPGWCVSMRFQPSRSWSVTRSAEPSQDRSSSRSLPPPATGR